ncbi:MAG TPA: hypothetical protein VKV95_01915 [Terriglobia bacterium]|nr:hypothetical protein [Terriglobia bacterium]
MTQELHNRAQGLIAAARVEGISPTDREWLDAHLQNCSSCSEYASDTEHAIRSLHLISVQVDPALVARTKRAVHIRARQLNGQRSQLWPLWMLCAISWVLGGITLPLVWRGIEWVGQYVNLPSPIEIFLLVLWWALPTLGVAAFISSKGAKAAGE